MNIVYVLIFYMLVIGLVAYIFHETDGKWDNASYDYSINA